ncbi:enoyl-CoA hydratase/isomerase family protein [Chloroflexota bacterium]
MTYETLLVEKQEGVGIITLNRPERLNAINLSLRLELDQALTRFENDDEVKAIIVTGAGDKAFSSGADIHEMSQQSEDQVNEERSVRSGGHERLWHLATCRKPTIGAINGLAYGAGSILSSLFDIRIGCEHTSFRFLMVSYGRVGATWTMPLIVGWSMAKELLLTGRVVGVEEALRIGLLNKVVPSTELMKAAVEMGQTIAANSVGSVQVIKEILDRDIGMSWRQMILNETETVSKSLRIPPPKESFKDFLERKAR